jgi:hypothetical protein
MPPKVKKLYGYKPSKRGVSQDTFTERSGIYKLVRELGGVEADGKTASMQISEQALKTINDMTRDLIVKFADNINACVGREAVIKDDKQSMQHRTLTVRTLNAAASFIIRDDELKKLNDANALACKDDDEKGLTECRKNFTTKHKVHKPTWEGQKDPIVFRKSQMTLVVKTILGNSFRIGKVSERMLTTRVQHIIGEVIGMACEVVKREKKGRIMEEHVHEVLLYDNALRNIFPAYALGNGMSQKPILPKKPATRPPSKPPAGLSSHSFFLNPP